MVVQKPSVPEDQIGELGEREPRGERELLVVPERELEVLVVERYPDVMLSPLAIE